MGLDIWSSDNEKHFHIGYIGFSNMRALFILYYGEDLYEDYLEILKTSPMWDDYLDKLFDNICEKTGDLSILINHSDCDGKLTSQECKSLLPCLVVDVEKIKSESIIDNEEYMNRMISAMYEFIALIKYCSEHEDVELIFG